METVHFHSYAYTLEEIEGEGDGLIRCVDCGHLEAPLWVTVFELTQEYGGPEEGGWWYHAGQVEVSLPLHELAPMEISTLSTYLGKMYPEGKNRFSVAPRGRDYEVRFAMDPGEDFPEMRPQYS